MLRFPPKTLFGQLLLGLLLVQTLLLGAFITYVVVTQRAATEARARKRLEQQLDRLSTTCGKLMASGDMGSVHDALELSRIATAIDVARITDLSGKTFALSDNSKQALDDQELSILRDGPAKYIVQLSNGQWEGATPVFVNGQATAMLWLEPSHSAALSATNTIVRISITYGLFALLINLLPMFLIVRRTTNPLKRLREATRHVEEPGQGGLFPLPITVRNEAGELTESFNTMVRNLEEQRSGLLETLALLDSMLGNAPIGFGFFDETLQCVRSNGVMSEICSASDDWIRQHVSNVFLHQNPLRDVELKMQDDFASSYLMHFYPVHADGKIWRVGAIAVEITERLQAEEALRKTEKLAATGRLAASIAHEINNPLEAVMNLLFLLQNSEELGVETRAFVNLAESELARVSEITQQTLRFHRQATAPTEASIPEMLDSVLKLYNSRIGATHIEVRREFRGEPKVFGFGGELRQVFANFIGNAIEAMGDRGTLVLRTRSGSGLAPDGRWCDGVRITVADTGIGMSAETLQRAFEAFFTTKQATGTGLGLWLSEEIVRKHQGSVRVKSRTGTGSGTVFLVFFPEDGMKTMELPKIELPH